MSRVLSLVYLSSSTSSSGAIGPIPWHDVYADGGCRRCGAFAARLDTGLCEWCTAEEKRSLCQCIVCMKRRADELVRLQNRPPYQGPPPSAPGPAQHADVGWTGS